jgi:gamma-glutamyl:cysteine ligase YbdK (ATP-grasp superfamily)
VLLHNLIAIILPYLPAMTASSPIYEGKLGENMDNRLHFYKENQCEIPSITADVIPEYAESFVAYDREVIGKYSEDLVAAGASKLLLDREWINSRGVIFRFDRRALEIRVMDEQECVKSDVALSCFIRALLRGLTKEETSLLQHEILVRDFNSVVKNGLNAKVENPRGKTARDVCRSLLRIALDHSTEEERSFLPIVQKRIENGNLSEILKAQIGTKSQKTDFHEAVISVYLKLTESLIDNQPHF